VRRLQKALQEWVSNPGESSETLRRKMVCHPLPGYSNTYFHLEIRETARHLTLILTSADIRTSYSWSQDWTLPLRQPTHSQFQNQFLILWSLKFMEILFWNSQKTHRLSNTKPTGWSCLGKQSLFTLRTIRNI
jgi:hypothetical protein